MPKKRVDILLVERGLAESRSKAQRLVMSGRVRADGQRVAKPSSPVSENAKLELDPGSPFVSRGGKKLTAALEAFDITVGGRICADVGASTGGFTDCLLQRGAARVYAIDVAQGMLHWKLRQDPRVVVMEATNARYLTDLPEPVSLATIDAAFISLKLLLPAVSLWFGESGGEVLALVKPQFEAGRVEASRGRGVIRDQAVHRHVLQAVLDQARELGYGVQGLIRSPLLGPKGNVEFFAWLDFPALRSGDVSSLISAALEGPSSQSV